MRQHKHTAYVSSRTIEPLLSSGEVAEILGLSRETVRRLCERGELHPVQISERRTAFDPVDVRELIQRGKSRRAEAGITREP